MPDDHNAVVLEPGVLGARVELEVETEQDPGGTRRISAYARFLPMQSRGPALNGYKWQSCRALQIGGRTSGDFRGGNAPAANFGLEEIVRVLVRGVLEDGYLARLERKPAKLDC